MAADRPSLGQRLVWSLEYLAVRGVLVAIQCLSPETAERFARGLGRAFFRLDARRRRTALENLRVALGSTLDEEARRRIAVRSFEHAFLLLVETVTRRRLVPNVRAFRRRTRYFGDIVEAREAARAPRGVYMLTAHLGNWEVAGAFLDYERVPFVAVARSVPNPYVQALLMETRSETFEVFGKVGAARESRRAIREGKWVTVLADQNASGRHGVFVPFFGVPASTYPMVARLAIRDEVPVFFAAAIRRGRRLSFDFHVRLHRPPRAPSEDPAYDVLRGYHAWLEEVIRAHPEQYLWMHRRFRTRPPGEAPGPHLPDYGPRKRHPRPVPAPGPAS